MKRIFLLPIVLMIALVLGACSDSANTSAEENGEKGKIDFPKKPIQIILGYAPGGATDSVIRIVSEGANKHLPNGQNFVVVNKPGGAGVIGTTEVFTAKPDGYTIGLTPLGPISLQPHYNNTPYQYDSFQPILRLVSNPQILVVKADAPWETFEEWLEFAEKNPGEFTYATGGKGGLQHLAMEALGFAADIETKPAPFESGAQIVNALMGGHVKGAVLFPSDVKGYIEAGDVRPLFYLGENISEVIKDIPTLNEKNIDVGKGLDNHIGLIAPKGLPKEELRIIESAFKKALKDPEVIKQLEVLGMEPNYGSSEDFQKDITDSYNITGELLKKIGLE